ncbi:serine hydrolase [Streptomyces sirii]|uniref:serine hydrolase n=1 Tax=Streptomyces sirii TaxID=3127701 RepID=UPI003D3690B3
MGAVQPGSGQRSAAWARLGSTATLCWLAGRTVTHSSNLATNLCLELVGREAVARVWQRAGITDSASPRGIEDYAGRATGVHNRVTALDLVRLLESLEPGLLMLLEDQERGVAVPYVLDQCAVPFVEHEIGGAMGEEPVGAWDAQRRRGMPSVCVSWASSSLKSFSGLVVWVRMWP